MALFGSLRFSSGASLVAVAILLCLGAFLSWSVTGPEVPATLTMGYSSHVDQESNGYSLNGSYLAVPAEETEDDDKGPVNAGLLLAFFFGMAAGWPLANGRGHEVCCYSGVTLRLSLVPRQGSPSLGVFRL